MTSVCLGNSASLFLPGKKMNYGVSVGREAGDFIGVYFMFLAFNLSYSGGNGRRFSRPPPLPATFICIHFITFSSKRRCTDCSRPSSTLVTWHCSLSHWVSESLCSLNIVLFACFLS